MDKAIDRSGHGHEAPEKSAPARRRPWHAPQFMLTEVAETDNQAAATTDGNAAQS
jgi:hypothetical protein